jgi:spore coat protein U-like protein
MTRVLRLATIGGLVAAAVVSNPLPVRAADATATLTVTATVSAECTATGGTLAFGAYSPLTAGAVDQTTTISVACTQGTSATVGLDLGDNPTGSTRRMADGGATNFLEYELYSDTFTTVWGNSGGGLVSLAAAPSTAPQALTVYGRIAGGQDAAVASYTDAITVTVTF